MSDKGSRTRTLVRWLKDKIEKRKNERDDHDPWWVTLMLDVGRPAVAIMILTMCAPGEHYLGVMAGWTRGMAWLTPATLTAYAGISAVVATKRPKGSPGHWTAVLGAILSIGLAMAAQPVAHLYEQHLITGHRFVLTIVVSVVPAAVFGHLLHMGAAPSLARRTRKSDARRTPKTDTRRTPVPMSGVRPDTVTVSPDMVTWTGHAETDAVSRTADASVRTPDIGAGSPSASVRDYLTDHPDASNDDLYAAMRTRHPGTPDNTFYVARKRFERSRTA